MIIKNGLVYQENEGFVSKTVFIENGLFTDGSGDGEEIDAKGCYVIPGLVDIHFHGGVGYNLCDDAPERLDCISRYELQNGITSICPATCAMPVSTLIKVCEDVREWAKDAMSNTTDPHPEGSRLVGINMEGPFLSLAKKGAHNPDYIINASREVLSDLHRASGKMIKLLAIAPETEDAMDFISDVSSSEEFSGMHLSIAHTTSDYELAKKAFAAGADHVTHLFNAMPAFGHRDPGVIGAAFDTEDCYVELIGDGVHVAPSVVRAAFAMFTDKRVVLISDTMRATGLGDGEYVEGDMGVTVEGKYARLKDGTIAGSVTNLMNDLRSVVAMGIPLESAVKCATINAARSIDVDEKVGSIEVGKLGDCVILDKNLAIVRVVKGGV